VLTFVIRSTAVLLGMAATLVIVGTFDWQLGWDIFSPALEKILYGVFFSALALAVVGIALCFILGIHELTELMRASLRGGDAPAERPMRHYVRLAALSAAILAALVGTLEIVDRRIQVSRRGEFQRLAREQIEKFGPKLLPELPADASAPVPSAKLALLVDTLDNVDFIADATLFVADPTDPEVLWRYTPSWYANGTSSAVFQRIFVTRSQERAARRALDGDAGGVARENDKVSFAWLAPVGDPARPKAVLYVTADESQDFRAFRSGP
jgi:hypothetical protein